jgi:hypothetical protein
MDGCSGPGLNDPFEARRPPRRLGTIGSRAEYARR